MTVGRRAAWMEGGGVSSGPRALRTGLGRLWAGPGRRGQGPLPLTFRAETCLRPCALSTAAAAAPEQTTVGMTRRFKGLDLIDRVPEELWMGVRDIVQEAVTKIILKKKKCKKAKWLSG